MIYARLKYTASVFWDAESIVANPADLSSLLKDLSPFNLIPITASERSSTGLVNRMAFQKSNGETRIVVAGKRLDIFKLPTDPTGSNMGSLDEFASHATKFFDILLSYFRRKGNRLALIQEGLLNKMDNREMQSACSRLFNLPAIYANNPPFEWEWKNVCKLSRTFGTNTELINTITQLSRSKMILVSPIKETEVSQTSIDTIMYQFDLNTSVDNAQLRFDAPEVKSFLQDATLWHSELSDSIFKFIGGTEE